MYQVGGTLWDAINNIEQNRYVLPAIQREFVWAPEQIAKLFDSLMQNYPFGTFLFWRVDAENSTKYKFYGFVRDYHQKDNPHCPDLGLIPNRELIAVLDGQQRLTALNIGLRGSMALKRPNMRRNNPLAYPRRHLHLNLVVRDEPDDQGELYEFEFLESQRASSSDRLWFKVSDIIGLEKSSQRLKWLNDRGIQGDAQTAAFDVLERLHNVIHTEKLVSYFEERSQNLDRVLNIFIRLNSAGTVLSYSDLLLSVATAQWSKRDARSEIHDLVDDLNGIGAGFSFSKDFILKAGLMLSDIASVGFKVENFTRANMGRLEEGWDQIRSALLITAQLAASFGLSSQGRWAESSLLPLAYYIHRRGLAESFLTHSGFGGDRAAMRTWLITSLLKPSGIWGRRS